MDCPNCRGTGRIFIEEVCKDCQGWGGFHGNIAYSGDHTVIDVPDCNTCKNTGRVKKETLCLACRGAGKVMHPK